MTLQFLIAEVLQNIFCEYGCDGFKSDIKWLEDLDGVEYYRVTIKHTSYEELPSHEFDCRVNTKGNKNVEFDLYDGAWTTMTAPELFMWMYNDRSIWMSTNGG